MRPSTSLSASPVVVAAHGRIDTFHGAVRIGGETFTDDGDTLTSHLSLAGRSATIAVSRRSREVTLTANGQTVVRRIPDGAVALENGSWQAYVLAAERYADAAKPVDVSIWVPSLDTKLGGTIQVERGPDGAREVTLTTAGLRVSAQIGANGVVAYARVYGQDVEARAVDEPASSGASETERAAEAWPPPGVSEEAVQITRDGVAVRGVIDRPATAAGPVPVVLVIAGSGPTDRDGNSAAGLSTDTYKQLAAALAAGGVATLRFDKRGLGTSDVVREDSLTLDVYADDARAFVTLLREDNRFSSVCVAGHSEGGLIALKMTESTPVDGLALLATAGRTLRAVLVEQLGQKLPQGMMDEVNRLLDSISKDGTLERVPPGLEVIFRPSTVPLLRSELDVDPARLLPRAQAKRIAVLQGTNDRQVSTDADARLLAAADPRAELVVLPGVSHVLKDDPAESGPQPSYFDPKVRLSATVVTTLCALVGR
jgi:pimeloyl-ACP methyl ester carboxylesterase